MDTAERLAAYQSALQDIRDLKGNQWRFSHYGLLLQAALVTVSQLLDTTTPCIAAGVLTIVSVVVFHLVLNLIYEAQGKIVQWRRATDSLQEPKEESLAEWTREFGPTEAGQPWWPWEKDKRFEQLFFYVQAGGMALAIWVIWSRVF